MNIWKVLIVVSLIGIVGAFGKWFADGKQIYTKTAIEVKVKAVDELFGTEIEKTELQNGFWLGLLPGAPPWESAERPAEKLGALPIAGFFVVLSGFAVWRIKKNSVSA